MAVVSIAGKRYDISLVVFDKDGLLFESTPFWIELSRSRLCEVQQYLTREQSFGWLRVMGVHFSVQADGEALITGADRAGMTALATPEEEIVATAACLMQARNDSWIEAKELAAALLKKADKRLNLRQSITPRPGFPEIFQRLRAAGIPYGLATSDSLQRAVDSIGYVDDANALQFIITPQEVRCNKPAPDMLLTIADRFHVPTERMLMIGDSFVDVDMASRCGAIGVGIPETAAMREKMRRYTDVIIDSLDEIYIEEETTRPTGCC